MKNIPDINKSADISLDEFVDESIDESVTDSLTGLYQVGTTKKGERIVVEFPDDTERFIQVTPGYIDERSAFDLIYIQGIKLIEKKLADLTTELQPVANTTTYPCVVYNYDGKRGIEVLNENNTFFIHGDENHSNFQMNRELEYRKGNIFTREEAIELIKPFPSSKLPDFYRKLRNYHQKFIWLEDARKYNLLTLFSIGTYFHLLFDSYPFLFLRGPVGCGKTRTNKTICSVAYHAIMTPNLSDAAFYYARQSYHTTLGLDEKYIQTDKDLSMLMDLINNSYKKGGFVLRVSDSKPRELITFEVYGPLIYSSIKDVPFSTSSRALEIFMEVTDELQFSDAADPKREASLAKEFRKYLYRIMLSFGSEIYRYYKSLSNEDFGIGNRDWELYRPFLALAHFFMPGVDAQDSLIELIQEHIKEQKVEKAEEFEYQVLLVLKQLIDTDNEMEDESFNSIKNDKLYLWTLTKQCQESLGIDPQFCSWRRVRKALKTLALYKNPEKGTSNKTRFFVDREKINRWIEKTKLQDQLFQPLPTADIKKGEQKTIDEQKDEQTPEEVKSPGELDPYLE